jgi:C-terminal processing protease CtpA/Prc
MTSFALYTAAAALFLSQEAKAAVQLETGYLLSSMRNEFPAPAYNLAERTLILDKSTMMFREIYAHYREKIAAYGQYVDPLVKLENLRVDSNKISDEAFHARLNGIFAGIRDFHSGFEGPYPMGCYRIALPVNFKPVRLSTGDQQLAVVGTGFPLPVSDKTKKPLAIAIEGVDQGDLVVSIDGKNPWQVLYAFSGIARGANNYGGMYSAIDHLSYRRAGNSGFPAQNATEFEFLKADGTRYSKSMPWITYISAQCMEEIESPTKIGTKFMLRKNAAAAESLKFLASLDVRTLPPGVSELKFLADKSVGYGRLENRNGKFGYLRISSFQPDQIEVDDAINFIASAVSELNSDTHGLIIDVRSNGGGSYGDHLVQLFSPTAVEAQTESVRATPTMLAFAKLAQKSGDEYWGAYATPVETAIAGKEYFSPALPINTFETLNHIGRKYFKPVIVLTNPSCYSYCDYFTTAMQDHHAAELWGENGWQTGAGGAYVLDYDFFAALFKEYSPAIFPTLPRSSSMRIATTDGYRTGQNKGRRIEDEGARVDRVHETTMDDLLNNDRVLFDKITRRLTIMVAK